MVHEGQHSEAGDDTHCHDLLVLARYRARLRGLNGALVRVVRDEG